MSNWDPQTPFEFVHQPTYQMSFTYDIDPSHQGTISFKVENVWYADSTVIESLVAAIVASADWELSGGIRTWSTVQQLDDGF